MFRDMGIDMSEIIEYVTYVDPRMCVIDAPKYPIHKDSHLNFLKPGSKEVLTRPVHIHEHLPPLNPPEDEQVYNGGHGEKDIDVVNVAGDETTVFKRPADGGLDITTKKLKPEEEGRPPREISSVMMTTSGFISPARQGKAPEARPPNLPPEFTKPIAPPISSPVFKQQKDNPSTNVDKKLDKKLKKKNHDKEKKKEKPPKMAALDVGFEPQGNMLHQMPREASEEMIMAERKKALKELRKKQKLEKLNEQQKKKREKPIKPSKEAPFDTSFLEKTKFEPFPVIPTTPSQVQAHNFLTGAAHFSNQFLDASNPFSMTSTPFPVERKLETEPDRNKLNIFKKISKPKDEFASVQKGTEALMPPMPETPVKKVPKLPKETTMTRVDDSPLNFSNPRSNNSSFEEMNIPPKTPNLPRTPDMKTTPEIPVVKEKKEKKKKQKNEDWSQQQQIPQSPFLQESNLFLQNFNNPGGLMGNFANPFSNLFQNAPGLIPRTSSFMQSNIDQVDDGGFSGMSGMQMDFMRQCRESMMNQTTMQTQQSKPKKVKQPKMLQHDKMPMHGSSRNLLTLPSMKIHEPSKLMNFDPFPLQQQHHLTSFDQLLQDSSKKSATKVNEPVETFDLTSSPEPVITPASLPPPTPTIPPQIIQPSSNVLQSSFALEQQTINVNTGMSGGLGGDEIKEKSKEKKKKKDKDKDKEKDNNKEERKKVRVRVLYFTLFLMNKISNVT
jgi:hypothetical protein